MEHLKVVCTSPYRYLLLVIMDSPEGHQIAIFDKNRDKVILHKSTLRREDVAKVEAQLLALDYLHHHGEQVPGAGEVTFDWSPQD